MKIRFNVQETIQRDYELDLVDSEKVIRRAEQIKAECDEENKYLKSFYYMCAIQELIDEGEIYPILVSEESEEDITSAWKSSNEEDS